MLEYRVTMTQTIQTVRGIARLYARMGIPLGRAYREACRAYPEIVIGHFDAFTDAYDDEVKLQSEGKE